MNTRFLLGLGALFIAACSATSEAPTGAGGAASGAGGAGGAGSSVGGGFATGVGGSVTPVAIGELTGIVLAPQGTIPISGALVYLTQKSPDPIPNGTYCDRCVKLPSSTPYTFSNPDGTFNLPVYSKGSYSLVVQKGAFRRIRPIDVAEGTAMVPYALTTLPGKTDKANGDDIPKMAVRVGAWDHIEDSLVKLGIAQDAFDRFEYKFPPDPADPFSPDKLMKDPATISKYHIVFVPCSGSSGTDCNDYTSGDSTVQKTVQDFVAAGGKLYVTDYSYDFVRQPFPGYIDWVQQTSQIGSACLTGSYDAPAIVNDPGLKEWLAAQGVTSFTLQASWTMIEKVNTVASTDLNGNPVNVTPKVWVTADTQGGHPSTVSFERACGRVLFSTYHTEGNGGAALLPQEKALLYVLLEVAVCLEDPIPK